MKLGTRSVLFGAHQFIIHPLCVAVAWWRLYGLPLHPGLWLCFFFHDVGYIGKPNMDGPEGERHPEIGARIVGFLLHSREWERFCLYHSRHYAKAEGYFHSRLCVADKLAFCVTPRWLYLLCTQMTGELREYMANGKRAKSPPCTIEEVCRLRSTEPWLWHMGLRSYMMRWVARHHDGREDLWTEYERPKFEAIPASPTTHD